MWSEVVGDVFHRYLQVFEERFLASRLIVERHWFGEDREVSRFLEISRCSEDEPARVVVKSTSDVVVSPFSERLVLVIASAVLELCRGDIDDALSCSAWYEVNESHEVLVRVAESHSSSHSAFEEGC